MSFFGSAAFLMGNALIEDWRYPRETNIGIDRGTHRKEPIMSTAAMSQGLLYLQIGTRQGTQPSNASLSGLQTGRGLREDVRNRKTSRQ